jgi:hypothetical protein
VLRCRRCLCWCCSYIFVSLSSSFVECEDGLLTSLCFLHSLACLASGAVLWEQVHAGTILRRMRCVALRCVSCCVACSVARYVACCVVAVVFVVAFPIYSLVARRRSSFVVVPRRSSFVGRRRPSFKNCSRIASKSFPNSEDFALWIDVGPEVVWSTRECVPASTWSAPRGR